MKNQKARFWSCLTITDKRVQVFIRHEMLHITILILSRRLCQALIFKKAFDVVFHVILLRMLFLDGPSGKWWLLKKDGYDDMEATVVCHKEKGDPFKLIHNIREGRLDSMSVFKQPILEPM